MGTLVFWCQRGFKVDVSPTGSCNSGHICFFSFLLIECCNCRKLMIFVSCGWLSGSASGNWFHQKILKVFNNIFNCRRLEALFIRVNTSQGNVRKSKRKNMLVWLKGRDGLFSSEIKGSKWKKKWQTWCLVFVDNPAMQWRWLSPVADIVAFAAHEDKKCSPFFLTHQNLDCQCQRHVGDMPMSEKCKLVPLSLSWTTTWAMANTAVREEIVYSVFIHKYILSTITSTCTLTLQNVLLLDSS